MSVGRNSQLVVTVGGRTVRPGSVVPAVGGQLTYFGTRIVTITKPGVNILIQQATNGPNPPANARWSPFLTL